MATQGGPAKSVSVQTGGQQQAGSAIPVAVVTDGRVIEGGLALPVYVVTSGPVAGGPAIPVVAAAVGAGVAAGPAVAVYVVSGSLGGGVPVNTGLPTITGTANIGQLLTASTGTWSNSPTSYAYQWKRGGVNIGGATNSTYTTVLADSGATITVTVTATNATGSASATSAGLAIFQPSDLTGMTTWYRAETIALNDNDPVTTWVDSGSGGIDVSQSNAANKPLYKTTAGPNSRPCVHFNSTVKVLSRATTLGSALVANNQCHIFIVQNQTGTNAQNSSFGWLPSASNRFQAHLTFADTLFWDFGNSTAGQGRISVAQPGGWDDTWHMVQLIREPPNSGTSRIRVDASQLASGAVTQACDGTATATWNVGSGVSPFLGFIAEIIMYNVALSATDRGKVETWLNGKYAIF